SGEDLLVAEVRAVEVADGPHGTIPRAGRDPRKVEESLDDPHAPIHDAVTARPALSRRFAHTPAMRSSQTMPHPPGSPSSRRAGKGLSTSVARNAKKPAATTPGVSGRNAIV